MEVRKLDVRLNAHVAQTRLLGLASPTDDENKAIQLLNSALSSLRSLAGDFAAALILFDFAVIEAEAPKKHHLLGDHPATAEVLKRWAFIAARDGAMSIFNFGEALHAISRNLAANPRIAALIKPSSLRTAHKLFKKHFPKAERMRHSIAHASEKLKSRQKFERHSFSGTYEGPHIKIRETKHLSITNSLAGRTYTATWDQEIISYELSRESADALHTIVSEVEAAIHSR